MISFLNVDVWEWDAAELYSWWGELFRVPCRSGVLVFCMPRSVLSAWNLQHTPQWWNIVQLQTQWHILLSLRGSAWRTKYDRVQDASQSLNPVWFGGDCLRNTYKANNSIGSVRCHCENRKLKNSGDGAIQSCRKSMALQGNAFLAMQNQLKKGNHYNGIKETREWTVDHQKYFEVNCKVCVSGSF